ncbi:HET-domain-containing protein [Rhizodiscina lignyota]|uniref:HET-domain-containing protein n=1 Tax=Rhizodiscina lignyota TaxID=1504668 RepID=A0A9P4IJS8_9PEZI|nr:HET-domain-containing protein [Rhizodiscina lignyota]
MERDGSRRPAFGLRLPHMGRSPFRKLKSFATAARSPLKLSPFSYSPLDAETEIRLFDLIPGNFNDPIRIRIFHMQLSPPDEEAINAKSQRLVLAALKRTLPAGSGWTAHRNVVGDYIFWHFQSETTSFDHPDPSVARELYAPLPQYPGEGFEPRYEALSYTWGSVTTPETIQVDELSSSSTMQIGQNLYEALKHMRREKETRRLWVDQICINQSDTTERSRQVQRMATIFKCSSRVVAWLGPESPDSRLAVKAMGFIGSQVEIADNLMILPSPNAAEPLLYRRVARKLPYQSETWQAIQDLLERSWFDRLWIWQEINFAGRGSLLQCGCDQLQWSRFARAVMHLRWSTRTELGKRNIFARTEILTPLVIHQAGRNPILVLLEGRSKKCADPRDKVYGLLGIMDASYTDLITVDYSLSVKEVYVQAFIQLIQWSRRLDVLRSDFERRNTVLPTWVLDPSRAPENGSGERLLYMQNASGNSCVDMNLRNSNVLEMTGVLCGIINSVSRPAPADTGEVLTVVRTWEPAGLLDPHKLYLDNQPLLDAYILTLCGNWISERFKTDEGASPYRPLDEYKSAYLRWMESRNGSMRKVDDALHALLYDLKGYRFLRSGSLMAIGSKFSEPGDLICIFLGSRTPMVLRPRPGERYQVIGSAYVHGVHDGEALLGSLPDSWKFESTPVNHVSIYNRFINISTGEVVDITDDPRLGPLPEEWGFTDERPTTLDASQTPLCFRNKITGEIINSDPRMLPDALRARGVKLRTFALE